MLAAAGAKERVGLSAAVHEGAVNTGIGTAPLYDTVSAVTAQCDQGEKPSGRHQGVFHQVRQEAWLRGWRWRRGRRGSWCRDRGRGWCRCFSRNDWIGGRCFRYCGGARRGRCRHGNWLGSGRLGRHPCWCCHCHSAWRGGRGCRRADGRRRSADLVQLINVLGQFGHAGGCFAGLLVLGQLVFCRLLTRDGALGQGEFVGCSRSGFLVFDARLHCAAGRALCSRHFGGGGCCRELAAESVEIAALCRQNLACFAHWRGQCSGLVRHLQHGAGLDPVDVALDEGVRVGAHQCHQHLVQRHAGRAVGVGQAASRIARLYGDAIGRSGARAGGRGIAGRRASRCRRHARGSASLGFCRRD